MAWELVSDRIFKTGTNHDQLTYNYFKNGASLTIDGSRVEPGDFTVIFGNRTASASNQSCYVADRNSMYRNLLKYDFFNYRYRFTVDNNAELILENEPKTGDVLQLNRYSSPVDHTIRIYRELKKPANGKIKDQTPGTVVNFSGSPWTILEPAEGYLFKNDSIAMRKFDTEAVVVNPALHVNPELNIVNGTVVFNAAPTLTLNTPNNATLYENDTFKIDGSAKDTNIGDILNVYYRINGGTARAIATGISTGAVIPFNEQLTFKGGVLYKGATAITGALTEGPAHRLEVWSEDNKGGKSAEQIRTFYVVPNRAPTLTVNPFTPESGMINADKVTISGESSDLDGNDVKVAYKLNTNAAVQIHSGVAGPWSFDLPLSALKDGENTIVVEVTDTYNFKSSKTIKFNKHANLTPLEQSVQRYKIVPPSGSAQGVLLWVQRDEDQVVSAEISMTTGSEQEQYVPMTLSNTAPTQSGAIEDEFLYLATADKENINVKFNINGTGPVTLISGVLS